MPKLLLLGTNDPYWVVDSLRHYWKDLPGQKFVFQTPNAGHDLAGGKQAIETLVAFYQAVADGKPLPRMTWRFTACATNRNAVNIEVNLRPAAKAFRLWTADSPDRDFRKRQWSSVDLPSNPGTHVLATVMTPTEGFRAYMIEAELAGPGGRSCKLSTEARVTPDGPPTTASH
jgi:PhoPQ-activated pathogenicity-related protein